MIRPDPPPAVGVAMNSNGVRRVAAAIDEQGHDVRAILQVVPEEVATPTGDGQGWAAWPAMRTVGVQWRAELSALADQLSNGFSEALRDAATDHENTDRESARQITGPR